MRIALILIFSLLGCSGSVDELVEATGRSPLLVETSRPFGYVNGDEIPQRIIIETPVGIALQTGSLPAKGPVNRWLNLNRVTVKQSGQRYQIDLLYQVFYAPMEVKALTLPGFSLQLSQGEKTIAKAVAPWTFTLSPLRELVVRQSEQSEYMRPDSPPPSLDNSQALYGLVAGLSVAVLTSAYLGFLYGYFPNMARRTLFKRALRRLSGLSKADMEQALTLVHQTLNSLNQQPLFSNRLSDFYRRNPEYSQLSSQLAWFFSYSNRYFFSGGLIAVAQDFQQLKELCEQCRKIERGSR